MPDTRPHRCCRGASARGYGGRTADQVLHRADLKLIRLLTGRSWWLKPGIGLLLTSVSAATRSVTWWTGSTLGWSSVCGGRIFSPVRVPTEEEAGIVSVKASDFKVGDHLGAAVELMRRRKLDVDRSVPLVGCVR